MNTIGTNNFGTIGGTAISAILGCNPWTSPLGLYLKIRNEAEGGSPNAAMERGIRFEDSVAYTFASNHPEFKVAHNLSFTDEPQRVKDETIEYLTGSPDRLLFAPDAKLGDNPIAGLEIKTASMRNRNNWGPFGTDNIPIYYLCQCQWYLGFYPYITDWRVAVQFFDDNDQPLLYGEYIVKRDDELIAKMRERAVEFWETHVVTGIPPECDTVDETVCEYVKQRYPDDLGTTEVAGDAENEMVKNYLLAKADKERAEAVFEAAKTKLQLVIKDASIFETSFGKITWKKTKGKEIVDYKALVEFLHPKQEVVDKFKTVKEGYRLFNDRGLKYDEQ